MDDRYWALQVRHQHRGWEIVVLDLDRGRITGTIALPEQAGPGKNVDYWAVSPRGQYVATYSDGDWISGGVPIPAGINIWSMEGEYLRTAPASAGGHVDYCLDCAGAEVLVFIGTKYGRNDKTGQMWRIDGSHGQETVDVFPDGIVGWNFHVSCASTLRPGYAVVSTFPMWNHAFAVRLDGSGEIAVIANVHHATDDATARLYRRSSFAVANRDLSAVWFTACWDRSTGSPIHSYVARGVR